MNIGLLFDFLASNIRCEECLHFMMNCELSTSTRSGFSHEIILTCSNCENAHLKLNTSSDSAQGNIRVELDLNEADLNQPIFFI